MEITVEMPDMDYEAIVKAKGRKVRGSLGFINPKKVSFTAYHEKPRERGDVKYIRLGHGKASVTAEAVRMHLKISLDESNIMPSATMCEETAQAACFIDSVLG